MFGDILNTLLSIALLIYGVSTIQIKFQIKVLHN